ncbi:MAG: leucine-rich repeat protein, partial [Prevotella sp.]|nr:leucine-rich repeat protein [Prevotella sp.]
FYSSQSLVKLILPPTIKRIGRSAFYECYRLKECQLPEGLEEIEAWALAGADNMKEWHIPASVRKIEWAAFSVPNFSSHTVYMYAEEPPADTHLEAFADWTMEKSVLYVPEGSLEVYRQTAPWSYFGTIKEFDPTNIKTLRDLNESDSACCYDLQGRIVSPESHGVRIMLTRNGVQKVVK